jgi:predicted PurR-regulated permease PerM
LRFVARKNRSVAAIISTITVFSVVVIPVFLLSTLLVNEFLSFYRSIDTSAPLTIDTMLSGVEERVQTFVPGFNINLSEQVKESIHWFTKNLGSIFAGTVSVVFTFLIAMFGSFYLFKDGHRLIEWIIKVSPLTDGEDRVILARIARSVRSVATGTVLVAILQGVIAALGFSIFGIDRAILWGAVAAIGALLPGIGTAFIMVPAIGYLFYVGDIGSAVGLTVWAVAAIVIIDNIISPYLMSRGNNLHPFVVLVSVLGGLSLFGPIGFILGPVVISLLLVLLELYGTYVRAETQGLRRAKQK